SATTVVSPVPPIGECGSTTVGSVSHQIGGCRGVRSCRGDERVALTKTAATLQEQGVREASQKHNQHSAWSQLLAGLNTGCLFRLIHRNATSPRLLLSLRFFDG